MSAVFSRIGVSRPLIFVAAGFTALMLMLAIAGVAQVRAQAPIDNVEDLIIAIQNANSSSAPETITLAAGAVFELTQAENSNNGLPVISGNITIEGNGATIQRDSSEEFRIFEVASSGALHLHDLTISNGLASGSEAESDFGGGIYNRGGTLTLTNSLITGNHADEAGGGIHNNDSALTLTDSTVSDNSAGIGGGISLANNSDATISNVAVSGNTAAFGGGGFLLDNSSPTISNSIVSDNQAMNGGGIIINSDSHLTLTDSTISNNTVSSSGGGIYNFGGTLDVIESTVSGNVAGSSGGGIANNVVGGELVLVRSTISSNRAGDFTSAGFGGAIYNESRLLMDGSSVDRNFAFSSGGGITNIVTGTLELTNSTISDNVTPGDGGGIYNQSGMFTLTNITVSSNEGNRGGGIYTLGDSRAALLANSIVAWNRIISGGEGLNILGPFTDGGHNITSGDPRLDELRDNGGPTETKKPEPNSPALNQIPLEDCDLATDQRGVERPQGELCDIGAVEVEADGIPDPQPANIDLVADPEMQTVGEDVTITATVEDEDENPVEDGTEVIFTVTGDGSDTAVPDSGIAETDANGEADFTYTNTTAGTDTVTATVEVNGTDDITETIEITWQPGEAESFTLDVGENELSVGAQNEATVSSVVDEHGNPITDGVTVEFALDRDEGDDADWEISAESVELQDGEATFEFSTDVTGTDTVSATIEGAGTEQETIVWSPGPAANIDLNVEPSEQTVGAPVTATAEVNDMFGNAVTDGTEVIFSIESEGDPELVDPADSWTVQTEDGEAAIAFTNTVSGTDTVTATVDDDIDESETVTWHAGVPASFTLTVDETELPVGQDNRATVHSVQDEFGNAVPDGVTITFGLERTDGDDAAWSTSEMTVQTGNGEAIFTFSTDVTGTDLVSATIEGAGTEQETVVWLAGPAHSIEITAEPTTQMVGEPVELTAQVTDEYGNDVADGTEVTLEVDRDESAVIIDGDGWTVETDGGVATIVYLNIAVGEDTVTATAGEASDSVTVTWQSVPSQPDPPDPIDPPDEPGDPDDPPGPSDPPVDPGDPDDPPDEPDDQDPGDDPIDDEPDNQLPSPGLPELPCVDGFGNDVFERTWARTDLPVQDGVIGRTWMWGPCAFTESKIEAYSESPDGEREVVYFDKSRMEINHPDADRDELWYVTNGLLVMELITGQRQFGDDTFEDYGSAHVNVAGDPDDPDSPTYASFRDLLDVPAQEVGTLLTARLDRDGSVTDDNGYAGHEIEVAHVDEVTNHGIASPFWDFMNSEGTVYEDGDLVDEALFENPFYATGRPVTEAYWATIRVDGEYQDVLVQVFERRVLTYTPGNDEGWQVEAGNVGQHYYWWRYVQAED